MENFTEIATELVRIYNLHKGKEFEAHYQGERKMPLKGTMRDVLEIDQGNPFASTLAEISNTVHQKYGTKVWRGITGPEDSEHFEDYWLWAAQLRPALEEGNSYVFKIVECTVFEGSGEFACGISIKLRLLRSNSFIILNNSVLFICVS